MSEPFVLTPPGPDESTWDMWDEDGSEIIESEVNGRHNAMQIAQGLADSQGHGYVVVPGVGREDAFDEDAYMTAWDEEGVVVYPNDEGAW